MSEVRSYRENWKGWTAARVEVWPDEGLPTIYVFPFLTVYELFDFEKWLDATIDMITGRSAKDAERSTKQRKDQAASRIERRTNTDRNEHGTS